MAAILLVISASDGFVVKCDNARSPSADSGGGDVMLTLTLPPVEVGEEVTEIDCPECSGVM